MILRTADSIRILVICHRKESLEHWQFHVDCFLENVHANVADNQKDTQTESSSKEITIVSLDYVLSHLFEFIRHNFDCVVFQDQHLNTKAESFAQLMQIEARYKIALCSSDLMVS